VLIDKTVLEKAHELRLNVSKAYENVLRHYIEMLQNATTQTISNLQTKPEKSKAKGEC
jgi:post-segregation antitoxin (ccd killing protein)